ncbi:hypothetical protein BDB00DRAFT_761466 [Zychaea mexicana]|uniref:uncharacterized protein n=1 Tax=Zychaea mexicana TaxID=64656 RepID=UPI0022FE9480|nr:uncharacterized protein BDB00DRAFT_761466 [Zychaea mexicana]KAI9494714.1 hypothetical protein BDB00DRAFT_761466 [Zychaea mexicana]
MSGPHQQLSTVGNEQFFVWLHQISFLVTGVCSTLGVQYLFYTGAASGSSFFTQLTGCVGSMLAGLVIPKLSSARPTAKVAAVSSSSHTTTTASSSPPSAVAIEKGHEDHDSAGDGAIEHFAVARLATIDMIASAFVTVGFSLIGILSINQWIAIVGTSIGLTFCAMDSMTRPRINSTTTTAAQQEADSSLAFGTALTVGGTFLYACVYVYGDHILSRQNPAPAPIRLCFYNGLYTSLITLIYIALYTMPRLDQLIHMDPIVSYQNVGAMYAFVTIVNATHAWNYYTLLESTGSVSFIP